MGWSSAGKIVSEQVLSLYNSNKLSKETLNSIVKPYIGSDCDTDYFYDKAEDGKDVHEIICKIMLPTEYEKTVQSLVFDDDIDEEDKHFINSNNGLDLFYKIWRETWKMW